MKKVLSWIALAVKTVCASVISLVGLVMSIPSFLIGALGVVTQLLYIIGVVCWIFDYGLSGLVTFFNVSVFFIGLCIFLVSCLLSLACIVLFFAGLYLIGSSISTFAHSVQASGINENKKPALKIAPVEVQTESGGTTTLYTLQ